MIRGALGRLSRTLLRVGHGIWRRVGTWAVVIFVVVLLVLPTLREFAPTRAGWQLFSVSRGGVVAQHPKFWLEGRAYGREDVYQALLHSAGQLQRSHPGSYVAYMDVITRRGGPIAKHLSHRTGRDVDILFFGRSEAGLEPRAMSWHTVGYVLNYDCTSQRNPAGWDFDGERGWAFLMALKANPYVGVERIFVEPCVEAWLLEAGQALGADDDDVSWAEKTLRYAGSRAGDHLDHFHIRFSEETAAAPESAKALTPSQPILVSFD